MLPKKAGCAPNLLNCMLHGRKLIKAYDIWKLSKALGVTVDDIYSAGIEGGDMVKK